MLILVVIYQIPFLKLWDIAYNPVKPTDYLFSVIVSCFVAYPILFILTIIYLKAKGFRVYLIYGKGELSLFGLFKQNEFRHFYRFLVDKPLTLKLSQDRKFPYYVDNGYVKKVPHSIMRIVVWLYRLVRAFLFYSSCSYYCLYH